AFDEKLHRVVAIKVLAPEMAATSPARKRFLREARSSAAVRHENVVAIYAVEDEPIPYLVMEYVPGQTLQQRLQEHGPLQLSDVLRLGRQIADGLAAAHAEGLIHRDIKPGNILLDTSIHDRVKITDFGLARTADDASMTQSGTIAGTPMYMAPEQALGHKLDQRGDLFSFGSVLYQMLSGRPPFRAPNTIAVLKRVAEDAPRPIREIIPEVPTWMCELVGHLHAKDPDYRYSTANEVSEILDHCAKELDAGRIPSIPNPTKAPASGGQVSPAFRANDLRPSRLRSPLAKTVAAAVVLLLALTVTEATGVTQLTSTVIRLATGSGTLVIETSDPGIQIAINGEEVTVTGGGVEELILRPGEYTVAALKQGQPVKQELVSITRNGRTVVRMSLESSEVLPDINAASPVANIVMVNGQPIDLIRLQNPTRDFLDDGLELQNGTLVTPGYSYPGAVGVIPCGPLPAEYDIDLQLERVSERGAGFNFGIVVGGQQVAVGMDCGSGEKVWGLDFLDGRPAHKPENPTRNPGRRLPVGESKAVTIQVRDKHVTATCDGTTLIDWTGDPKRLSVWSEFKVPKTDSLFFVSQAAFRVHKMTLTPRAVPEPEGLSATQPQIDQNDKVELIDVITRIDPSVDTVGNKLTGENNWRIENSSLINEYDEKPSKLVWPVDVRWPSYEFEIDVTRTRGDGGFTINIPDARDDTQWMLVSTDNGAKWKVAV
ncbi:MAG: serine/threonine protein kinase, partial [Planctomycetaceae bacterium]|nr:serine/threonine protein kinase [Planctomycetaceae bacterium]